MMKRILAATMFCLIGATLVVAAENQKDNREATMKKVGGAMGAMVAITKGEKPYDAEVVKTSLTAIGEAVKVFPNYFPAGSENDSVEASPKIWANMDDFKARAAKLGADANMLLSQLPADQAAVAAAVNTLGENCAGCHKLYRLKK